VVLDKPIAIEGGDFIGYLGHNMSRKAKFSQKKVPALATEKRPSNPRLSPFLQGHIELFTGDDLPAFITKTRALADKLPESEKPLILVEQGAQLVSESPYDRRILSARHIKVTGQLSESVYVKANVYYKLRLTRYQCTPDNVMSPAALKTQADDEVIGINQVVHYRLTADDKAALIHRYQIHYPELTVANIPDTVELIGNHANSPILQATELPTANGTSYLDEVEIQFSLVGDKPCWVKSVDVTYLAGGEGQLNQSIVSWNAFPLTLTDLPDADESNTVHYPRTLPLASIKAEYHLAIDEASNYWAYITAGNVFGCPIRGWVNISKGESDYLQPHIKRISPWAWSGVETVKETANVANLVEKLNTNRKMTLDLEDYTESMTG